MTRADGFVESGYEAVREVFIDNFANEGDVGAAVSAWVGGRPVVSLWGGLADPATGQPWGEDTIVVVFSMSKGLTSTAVHHLAERGGIDLGAPVADSWPEFAVRGKDAITLRTIMGHRAGLPYVEGDFTLAAALAWDPIVASLAAQTPVWPPGTAHGYHLRTFGWLVGEAFRRASGRSVGTYVSEEMAGPLGLDWHLGTPAALDARTATMLAPGPEHFQLMASLPQDMLLVQAAGTPSGLFRYDGMWNERAVRAAELPSSNSHTNAAAAARLYASLIGDGVAGRRTLRPDTIAGATAVLSSGPDRVLLTETSFGTGYQVGTFPPPSGPRSFGHGGAGGSVGFADPDAGVAFAYTPNQLRFDAPSDPRKDALVAALYAAIR